MTKITYIEHNGKEHTVDVQNGLTVMEGAVQNDIPGWLVLLAMFMSKMIGTIN